MASGRLERLGLTENIKDRIPKPSLYNMPADENLALMQKGVKQKREETPANRFEKILGQKFIHEEDEILFQDYMKQYGVKNPDDPRHNYDYRSAYEAGIEPTKWSSLPEDQKAEDLEQVKQGKRPPLNPEGYMWPDEFKLGGHVVPSKFKKIFERTMKFEGGYVVDSGGPTNLGITQETYDHWRKKKNLPVQSVTNITEPEAYKLTQKEYYINPKINQLPDKVGSLLFDYGLNSGPDRAIKVLQSLIGAKEDGKIGKETLNKTATYIEKHGEDSLLQGIIDQRSSFMKRLIEDNPKKYKENERGWQNRIQELKDEFNLSNLNLFKVEEAEASEGGEGTEIRGLVKKYLSNNSLPSNNRTINKYIKDNPSHIRSLRKHYPSGTSQNRMDRLGLTSSTESGSRMNRLGLSSKSGNRAERLGLAREKKLSIMGMVTKRVSDYTKWLEENKLGLAYEKAKIETSPIPLALQTLSEAPFKLLSGLAKLPAALIQEYRNKDQAIITPKDITKDDFNIVRALRRSFVGDAPASYEDILPREWKWAGVPIDLAAELFMYAKVGNLKNFRKQDLFMNLRKKFGKQTSEEIWRSLEGMSKKGPKSEFRQTLNKLSQKQKAEVIQMMRNARMESEADALRRFTGQAPKATGEFKPPVPVTKPTPAPKVAPVAPQVVKPPTGEGEKVIRQIVNKSNPDIDGKWVVQNKEGDIVEWFNSKTEAEQYQIKEVPPAKTTKLKDTTTIYRGETLSSENRGKGGIGYYSLDKGFATEFTQTGRKSEVKSKTINTKLIYDASLEGKKLPSANNEQDFDSAMAIAKEKGYYGFRLTEGKGQPDSIYIFDKKAFDSTTSPKSEGGETYYRATTGEQKVAGYTYLAKEETYAKNFGDNVKEYKFTPQNALDIKSFGIKDITYQKLVDFLSSKGVNMEGLQYDPEYEDNAWFLLRRNKEMVKRIDEAGYDSISLKETFDNKTAHETLLVLDADKIQQPTPKSEGGEKVIYHGTGEIFDKFDIEKSADGSIWFTDNKSKIEKGEVSATGKGQIMERIIDENKLKLGGWKETDKYSTDELMAQGYDGLKLVDEDETTYQIFNPEKLTSPKTGEVAPKSEGGEFEPELKKAMKQPYEMTQEEWAADAIKKLYPDQPKAGGGGDSMEAAGAPGGGYGIIESSERSSKVRVKKTDESKVTENAPTKVETNYIKEALKIVSPASVSDVSQVASQVMRKGLADLAHKDVIAMEALKKAHAAFSWTSKEDGYKFIDAIEQGAPQENPKLQPFADAIRGLLDQRRDMVRGLGKGQLESFYENYFPHIWKDPDNAKSVIMKIMGRKRLEGSKSFLKKRTLMTVKDGLEIGLEPVSDNPVDLVMLKLHEMDRYIMAQNIIRDLKAKGLTKFVYVRSRVPDGYTKINDNAFTVYMPPEITKKEAFDSVLVDQMMDVAKSLGIDTKRLMALGGKRWGWARDVGKGVVRTRFASPESVLAHEIGHVLGYNFDLFNTFRKYKDTYEHTFVKGKRTGETVSKPTPEAIAWRKKIDEQWRALADARYKGLEASDSYKKYVRKSKEKEAVLLEAFIHAPFEFKKIAPDIYKLFTKFLNEHGQLRPILDIKPSLVLGESEGKIKIPGFTTLGHYYAPKDVALIINNHLSPGLRNNENKLISTSYNLTRGFGNVLNQVNLSMSGFHALNVTTDMMASTIGLGLRKLTIGGQRLAGIKDIATFPVAPVTAIWNGARIKRAYRKQMDSIEDPKLRAMISALVTSGGRDRMDVFYYNQQIRALQKTLRDILKGSGIDKALGAVRLPFNVFGSVVEALAKPLMEWYVPTGKLGLFAKLAESELARAEAGEITDEQLVYMLTKVWDSVDNRMGQLIYDNLFWNKILKDSLMLAIRSVGWNLGSWREYGGSAVDLATTGKRIRSGDKLLSHKMTYATGAAILYAILGAIITYMLTGKPPKEPRDYFFPRTGKKNADGSDERLSLPTYAKDIYAYTHRPFKTLRSKRHPLIGLTVDQATNKDFFSVEVSDFEDPLLKQVNDRGEHIVNYAKPFSWKNYEKMQKVEDAPLKNAIISISGIVSAPSYITRSPAQKLMYRTIADRMPDTTRTKEDFEKSQYRKTLKTRIRKGEWVDAEEAKKVLGAQSWSRLKKDAKLPPFAESFKRLSLDEALNVYAIATAEEKAQTRNILRSKYGNQRTRPSKEVQDLFKELMKVAQ